MLVRTTGVRRRTVCVPVYCTVCGRAVKARVRNGRSVTHSVCNRCRTSNHAPGEPQRRR